MASATSATTNLNQSKKIRKPLIPVRQTKTSKIRTEHNTIEYYKKDLLKMKENTSTSITSSKENITSSKDSLKSVDTFKKPFNNIPRKSVITKSNEIVSRTNSGLKSSKNKSPPRNSKQIPLKSTLSEIKLKPQNTVKNTLNKTTQPKVEPKLLKPSLKTRDTVIKNEKKTVKIQSPLRKSISAMHLKRVSIRDPTAAIYRSFSTMNVSQQTIHENVLDLPNFTTPMGKRRSVYNSTPATLKKNKNLSPWSGCWSPTAQDLKRRLNIWMEKNNKSYNTFTNLRYFGLHYSPEDEENKENVCVDVPKKDSSYEDLKIKFNDSVSDKSEDLAVGFNAIKDLRMLISEGYSLEQCEAWLDVIRTRFEEIEDTQEYWECMAAIDKARGNIETNNKYNGNESYINNLMEQFTVMNLTPSSRRSTFTSCSEIFKSTAINFAVKECSKNEETQYLVTPIRRSTRRSTAGKTTPGIIVCSTLDELDSSVRKSMRFRTNKALKK